MATNFRFVAHAAERKAHEIPTCRARDGLAERRLTDPRRTDKAENRSLDVRLQLAYRQIFENPILDLLQTGVVLVEDLLGMHQLDHFVGAEVPGQRHQPVEIRA